MRSIFAGLVVIVFASVAQAGLLESYDMSQAKISAWETRCTENCDQPLDQAALKGMVDQDDAELLSLTLHLDKSSCPECEWDKVKWMKLLISKIRLPDKLTGQKNYSELATLAVATESSEGSLSMLCMFTPNSDRPVMRRPVAYQDGLRIKCRETSGHRTLVEIEAIFDPIIE